MKGSWTVVLLVAFGTVGVSVVRAQNPAREPRVSSKQDGVDKIHVPPLTPFPGGYLDHASLTDALQRVAAAHPDTVKVESLARSKEGRDVWIVTIGPAAKGAPAKPSILVVANLEADHLVGAQVALGLIERLAGTGAKSIAGRTIHVVPRLNPDGAERLLKGKPGTEIRANLTRIDRDRDGRFNEDGPNDLDGDGMALTMRSKDNKASLVPDAADPRILRKADPIKGEQPVYSETTEGLDDDGDGLIDEDPTGGVNLNRNWPHGWTEYAPETGVYPTSEPEVNALIRFAYAHPEIVAVWSFGLNDNLKEKPRPLPPGAPPAVVADAPHLAEIIKAFATATTPRAEARGADAPQAEPKTAEPAKKTETPPPTPPAAAPRSNPQGRGRGGRGGPGGGGGAAAAPAAVPAPGLEGTTDGALSEWAYHQFGVVGLSSRLWPQPEAARGSPALSGEGEARWLEWNDKVMGGSAFVPFHPVTHPTLGKVEVGGWKPGVRLNPPIEQIGAIVDTHFAFLQDLASRLPSLSIKEAKAEAKGGGIFEIKATIENTGTLPTALAQGVVTRKSPPVMVKLTIGDARLISGRALNRIDSLAGAGSSLREFRWVILVPGGKKTLTLEASCAKAGSAKREISLP